MQEQRYSHLLGEERHDKPDVRSTIGGRKEGERPAGSPGRGAREKGYRKAFRNSGLILLKKGYSPRGGRRKQRGGGEKEGGEKAS